VADEQTDEQTVTIVIHLPQPIDKMVALLQALAIEWPDVPFTSAHWLAQIDIPASR
jgi:hypothetical protein